MPPNAASRLVTALRSISFRNWRKQAFRLHGWLGLNVGMLLFVVCLSGTFATISDEIDVLVDPRHRVAAPTSDASAYDWTAMVRTLQETFPDGVVQGVYAPGASGRPMAGVPAAALAFVLVPSGETRKAYLDPFTGELTGHTGFFNVERFFRTFHRRLFDGERGILLVTLTAFVLLTSGLTGFGFYRGWLKQMRTLQLRGTRRRRWSDLHKLAGIWGLPFTVLIAVTGIYYFVEVTYQRAGDYDALLPPPMAQVDPAGLDAFGPQPDLLPAGRYVELARQAYPDLDVRSYRPPQAPGQAVYVDGQAGNPLTRDRSDQLHLHPFTGEVLDVQRTSDLGLVPFLTDAVDPIHFGYFGGLGTQILWFVLGLLLSFSILSGMYVWVVRSVTARKGPSPLLRGAPVAVAVTLGYLGVVGVATLEGIRGYAPPNGPPVSIGAVDVGPYEVRVDCEMPCAAPGTVTLAARFLGSGLPNYAQAEVLTSDGSIARLAGPASRPRARANLASGQEITLRVATRDGLIHEAVFVPSIPAVSPPPLPTWPDAAPGVWWVVVGFSTLLVGSILGWLALVWRVVRARRAAHTRS